MYWASADVVRTSPSCARLPITSCFRSAEVRLRRFDCFRDLVAVWYADSTAPYSPVSRHSPVSSPVALSATHPDSPDGSDVAILYRSMSRFDARSSRRASPSARPFTRMITFFTE